VGEGISTTSLSYYQDIGIQLNVVPQINSDNFINMIIHPAVTSYTERVGTNQYPIILSRETETQILIKNGETIVIGGLLKDIKTKSKFSVPLLGDIPFLGKLFQRNTDDIEKVDLLVFITAHIVESEAALAKLEEVVTPKPAEQPVKSAEPVKPTEPEPVKKE
jgi:general secretion pathway protein D